MIFLKILKYIDLHICMPFKCLITRFLFIILNNRESDALDVSKCTSEKKKALFTIANKAFPISLARSQSAILSTFQLIETYLGKNGLQISSPLNVDL